MNKSFVPTPIAQESPLWAMSNVIIRPHVGGQAAWRIDRMTEMFCRNLPRWQEDRPLINRLTDKRLGFPIHGTGIPIWGDA